TADAISAPDEVRARMSMQATLLTNLRIVKRARFNAAKRARAKHEAGQFVLALTFVYGSLVPLFTLQLSAQIGALQANLLSFVAAVASMLSFVVAVHYQQQRLEQAADAFHACGLALNKLRYEIKTAPEPDRATLLGYLERYDATLARCPNHDAVDYDRAVMGDVPDAPLSARIALQLRTIAKTYSMALLVIALPPLVGWLIYASLGA
ncbi:MAG: SLATT domain-containing protein, partial [Pseudomonadota bacterium]